jgi:O-succinylbenzoic acid--CoA ligase
LHRLGAHASTFRSILLGGARPPAELPPNVVATYGMTETGSGVVYDGRALDGVEVRIAEGGQIHLRGPMLLRSYRDGRDPKTDDGWLPTGDAGQLTDGELRVLGRIDDLIISGGENVWPGAVEEILAHHEGIADVAIGAVPDAEWGQRVVAYVIATNPSLAPQLDDLRDLVRSHLGPWAAPRDLVLTTELPRTSNGKIQRADLEAFARDHAVIGPRP